MSVLVSVRPLNSESKMARAVSAVDSVEIPKMSGRNLPENAVSGAFGLISSARDAAGGDASPITSPMASIETSAWRGMKHPGNRGQNRQWKRAGLRQTLNRDVNVVRRF